MSELILPTYRYCPTCGGTISVKHHEGCDRPVCDSCGRPIYVNPVPATCQIVLESGCVLLTLRAVDPQKGMWCLPGGFIEWGEAPEAAAKRELAEETGVIAERMELTGVYDSTSGNDRHVLVVAYHVTSWSGEPVAGDDADEVRWFELNDIPELAFKVHHQALVDALKPRRCCC